MARIIDSVVGHDLQKHRIFGSLVKDRLASTLLFVGPEGVGKRQVAMALGQALACETAGSKACGKCPSCRRMEAGQSENLLILQPSGASIKIEQSRQAIKFLSLENLRGGRLVLIDEAHKLTTQAANSLLKVLEEPPEDSYVVLVAPSDAGLLPTIRSRAQVVRFGPLSKEELSQLVEAEDWVLEASQGSVTTAESFLEESKAEVRRAAFQAWEHLIQDGHFAAMETLKDYLKDREACLFITRYWQQILRDAYVHQKGANKVIHSDFRPLIQEMGQLKTEMIGQSFLNVFQLERDLEANVDKQLAFENFCRQFERGVSA